MKTIIGIPAHNEAGNIAEVVRKSLRYGLVLVLDNGSTDNTAAVALDAGAVVQVRSKSGYGYALQEIFSYAKRNEAEALVTLDGDGQHNPDEVPLLLEALQVGDVVLGNRFVKGRTPAHRQAVIKGLNAAYRVGDSQCGFRAYNRRAIETIHITEDGMGASLEILSEARKARLNVMEVPVTVTYEDAKSPSSQINQGMNLVETLFYSTGWARPYTYLGVPALILLILCGASGLWALGVYAEQRYLVPSAALICGVSFLGGVLLMSFAFYVTISRKIVKEVSKYE